MKVVNQVFCPNCQVSSTIDYTGASGLLYQTCPACSMTMQPLHTIIDEALRRFHEQNKPQ